MTTLVVVVAPYSQECSNFVLSVAEEYDCRLVRALSRSGLPTIGTVRRVAAFSNESSRNVDFEWESQEFGIVLDEIIRGNGLSIMHLPPGVVGKVRRNLNRATELVVVGLADQEANTHYDLELADFSVLSLAALGSATILLRRRGIVDEDSLKAFISAGLVLANADIESVRSANYDLSVGNEVWCQGKLIALTEEEPDVKVPPYSYVIASAKEDAVLPSFVCGRFDLKVSLFFRGIILSNGPQIDPGYHGALFCLLFNSSDVDVWLRRGQHFATIEFDVVATATKGYREQYQFKKKILEFMESEVVKGPGGTLISQFQGLRDELRDFEARIEKKYRHFVQALIGLGALFVAALVACGLYLANEGVEASNAYQRIIDDERSRRGAEQYLDELSTLPEEIAALRAEIAALREAGSDGGERAEQPRN